MLMEIRLERSDETQAKLEASDRGLMDYHSRWGRDHIGLCEGRC